jgi:hypothetical protein
VAQSESHPDQSGISLRSTEEDAGALIVHLFSQPNTIKRHKASPSCGRRRDEKSRIPRVKPPGLSYPEIVAKLRDLPAQQDVQSLATSFLRDELRQLLKKNGVSYHKPGPANLMKTKNEMTADLLNLLEDGLLDRILRFEGR